ncbi:hypothetical protein [Stenotrophomonas maltophilia]|uniref:hypothetical protein n=1 Tax=Stenotrophomonas maltophilia TaxID=40324 RepID=UPI0015E01312|nr:hypothetical protein [Stenotrophomonas maltophilia]MBA0447305.1 hypothetical protein [Stenotrophomonas maltophilia]
MTTAVRTGLTDLVADAQRYLRRILPGLASAVHPLAPSHAIPHAMASRYLLAGLMLYGETPAMLAVAREPGESSTRVIQDVRCLRSAANALVLYVSPHLTPTQRRFLVENHIDFVVPHAQLFAPSLAIEFRDAPDHEKKAISLLPSAQAVLIHVLLTGQSRWWSPREISATAGYTSMTASRLSAELVGRGLVERSTGGRERFLRLAGNRDEVWARAQPFLRSPVLKEVDVCWGPTAEALRDAGHPAPTAGLDALADTSPPAIGGTRALHIDAWRLLGALPMPDPDCVQSARLQIWAYPPAFTSIGDVVDPLSLYLSLRGKRGHDADALEQRVEQALSGDTYPA